MSFSDLQFRILYIICLGHGRSIAYSRHQRTIKALLDAGHIGPTLNPLQATVRGYQACQFEPVQELLSCDLLDANPLAWTPSPAFPWHRLI